MCARYLGFVLLIWFPGVIHAQRTHCQAPKLNGGYLVPEQNSHSHGTSLTYACDHGLKPVVEGWWVTSICKNGKWSHEPQCIAENSCLPPSIPNGKSTENQKGWYEENSSIEVTCEEGYELMDKSETFRCINGNWSSLPVCEKSNNSCSEPPKILHAVVINKGYQEVFASGSSVQYECEHGYTKEGTNTIICEAGTWTVGPKCSQRRTATSDRGTQTEGSGRGNAESAGRGRQPSGEGRETTGHQGGSSTTINSNERDSRRRTTIESCGSHPEIENAVVVEQTTMYLKYQCNSFYKQHGPETVECYSDGTWSELPTCEDAFCKMDPAQYARYGITQDNTEYMKEGERKYFSCSTSGDHFIIVRCTNRRITLGHCCPRDYLHYRQCQ